MTDYIELAKKRVISSAMSYASAYHRDESMVNARVFHSDKAKVVLEESLTAYSEALRAKDKEELASTQHELACIKASLEARNQQLAATQLCMEKMREQLFDAMRRLGGNENQVEFSTLSLQPSTDALIAHEARVLEEVIWVAGDCSDTLGNIYSSDFLSVLRSMVEEKRATKQVKEG